MTSFEVTVRIRVVGSKCEDVVNDTIDAIFARFPTLDGVQVTEVVEATTTPTVH